MILILLKKSPIPSTFFTPQSSFNLCHKNNIAAALFPKPQPNLSSNYHPFTFLDGFSYRIQMKREEHAIFYSQKANKGA